MFKAKTLKEKLTNPCITRFAPSPTGFFHVGSARTALQAYLSAEASGGEFLLRIDDTDVARNTKEAEKLIFHCLSALNIDSEKFFRQSERRHIYFSAVLYLLVFGFLREDAGAYFLSEKAVDLLPDKFYDLAAGWCRITDTTKDQVYKTIVKTSLGNYTYQLASIVDDIVEGVNFITRGADHLPNTPKQIAIALALKECGWGDAEAFCQNIDFAHSGLLCQQNKKISKRDNTADFIAMLNSYDVRAIKHWLLQLGWSHPDAEFDKKYRVLAAPVLPSVFIEGNIKIKNVEINLQKLQNLHNKYKAVL